MTSALERTLFLLTQFRLLLLEIQDVERQLERLASTASPTEKPLLEEGMEALEKTTAAGRSALVEIEALVPTVEAERDRSREAT